MNGYVVNRTCPCARCRARGLMGAAVLITLGVLLLIHTLTRFEFGEILPVLLIVIGLMLFAGRSASTEGHVQPSRAMAPVPPPPPVAGNQPGPEVNR
jgi:hypothetical protein